MRVCWVFNIHEPLFFSAINTTTLKVDFNNAVTDETKAVFAVQRTDANNVTVNVAVTPTWAADKKTVNLTAASTLVKGNYTVTVTGLEFAEGKNVATAAVDNEKVGEIKILGTKMIDATGNNATVKYQVLNQYGEDVTKKAVSANLQFLSSLGTAADANKGTTNGGTITIAKGAPWAPNDTAVVTVIDPATSVKATATLAYASALAINNVEFGTGVLPTGKTKVEVGLNPAVTIPLTVTDEFGNAITDATTINNNIDFILSKGSVGAGAVADANNKPVLNLDTTGISDAGNVTITALVKASGASFSTTVEIVKASAPAEVAFGSYSDIVAAGDAKLVLPITVKDQFGTELTADAIAKNASAFTITSSNGAVIDAADLEIVTSGTDKGKVALKNTKTVKAKGSTVITVSVNATGKSSSITIAVSDTRHETVISLPANFNTNLIQGAEYSFAVTYKDQYGKDYTSTKSDTNDYKVKATLTKISGDDNCVTIDKTTDQTPVQAQTANNFKLTAATSKAGSYKLAVQLIDVKNSNTVISEVTKTITVVANSQTGLTYNMADIPTIAGDQVYSATTPDAQARPIKVSATDASGNIYALPDAQVFNVTSSDTSVATVGQYAGKWYVAGAKISGTANKTATITAFINTENGVQQVSKTVTVSPVAPKTQQIVLVDKVAKDNWTLDTTAKTITELTFANRSKATEGTTMFAYALDQYGVYTLLAKTAFTPSDTTKVNMITGKNYGTDGQFEFDGTNKFKLTESEATKNVNYRANTPLYFSLFDGAVSANLKVTIVAEEAPTASIPGATGAENSGTALKVTFSEPLYVNGTALADGADVKSYFTYSGTAANYTSATYATADNSVTFAFTAAEDTKTLKANTTFTDAAGNAYVAETMTYAATGTIWSK